VTHPLVVLSPMGMEARAVRAGARPDVAVHRTGIGRRRAERAAGARHLGAGASGVAIAGIAGALDASTRPGDVVVASELVDAGGRITRPLPGAPLVAAALRRDGLTVHIGRLVSSERVVTGAARARLAERSGALVVDMESEWLAPAAGALPLTIVRTVADTGRHRLLHPETLRETRRALAALRSITPALERWARACAPTQRTVLVAGPRSFCAGVERAIDTVERALDRFGAPVFVRRQIVHNTHVVGDLEARGAIFVEELEEVPPGSTVVLAAHGVAPSVHEEAESRHLHVIDATCPLVAKVHHEARRFASRGYDIVLLGHAEHEEIVGTRAEAPEAIHVVDTPDEVDALPIPRGRPVAYLTQTTLAVDETSALVERLRDRHPHLVGPAADDICYATQNRQEAIAAIAGECDVVLVVGSRNSSNSNRLVEVAARGGSAAYLVEDEHEVDPGWLVDASTVGITAGASAPDVLVDRVIGAIAGLGPVRVEQRSIASEAVQFSLPAEVR
jgi:4-hydroxy-3-methylbut-2-enyl diphosphate reductase